MLRYVLLRVLAWTGKELPCTATTEDHYLATTGSTLRVPYPRSGRSGLGSAAHTSVPGRLRFAGPSVCHLLAHRGVPGSERGVLEVRVGDAAGKAVDDMPAKEGRL